MLRYLAGRCAQAVLTVFVVVALTFVLARIAGDPTALLLPATATAEDAAEFRQALGLDRPLLTQFVQYLADVSRLDFGESLRGGGPAFDVVLDRMPATLSLAGISLLVSLVLALGLGLVVELSRSERLRSAILALALLREAVPVFVFGLLLVLVFGVHLQWLPFIGRDGPATYVLPVLTLSSMTLALYLRILRSSFGGEEGQDYLRTAAAKGASRRYTILREALPNVMPPFVTTVAINLGYLVVGSVLVESVFSWPGVAYTVVEAVTQRDFPVIQAGVIAMAVVFVVINLLADLISAKLDPRIRL
ncbi:ABC transporter permease [Pseudonocardia sp. NPDC049635]|uniref:ABC transporter permease n=1 Tax=Pseudonocardia sp. NPDC049635 TaxID=3155506 RepID=UPI00341103F2